MRSHPQAKITPGAPPPLLLGAQEQCPPPPPPSCPPGPGSCRSPSAPREIEHLSEEPGEGLALGQEQG